MKIKLATVLIIISMLFGGWLHIDRTKADAGEFNAYKKQSEKRWIESDWYSVRKRIWSLEDRYGPTRAKMLPEYQELILEKETLELKLKGK